MVEPTCAAAARPAAGCRTATRRGGLLLSLALAAALGACGERELILPGEREAIRPVDEDLVPVALQQGEALPALAVPAPQPVANWAHLNGSPQHIAPSATLAVQPRLRWSRDIGAGDARRTRLTAAPVVAGGVIYTLDSGAVASAFDTSGRMLWQTSLKPAGEGAGNEGFGGGLAAGDGALVAATGFGEVLRLDPGTGAILWRTETEGAIRAAPTVSDGRAVVVARGDIGYGVDLESGRLEWRVQGTGLGAGLLGGSSPAVRGPVAIIPFQSGEVSAVLVRNGLTVWNAAVTGGRRSLARARIQDISGDPVIDNDIVYAANQAGRLVALDRRSGERLWTHRNGAYGPALPIGGSVFIVSDIAEVLRIDARSGAVLWAQQLPEWENPDRRRRAIPHYGPVLAGGRLLVASGDGLVRFFDPASGRPLGSIQLPGGVAAPPALAGGTLYLVTDGGQLLAFQ